jgi:hypothetical protein
VVADTPDEITAWRRQSAYGLRVGTTGLIFGAIAIAWLAYLVPYFARRRDDDVVAAVDPADRFSESMRILKRGTAPLLDQDLAVISEYEVSTPMTRRAAIRDLQRLEALAARRRRRVLLALLAVLTVVVGLAAAGLVPWWAAAVPGGLLLAFVVVARVSVRAMQRSLDARYTAICAGSDEVTVVLSRKDVASRGAAGSEVSESKAKPGVLWDPIPITMPTYVSKPLAPRTVRTIDLSGPDLTATSRNSVPVTADAPPAPARDERDGGGEALPEAATA